MKWSLGHILLSFNQESITLERRAQIHFLQSFEILTTSSSINSAPN